MWKECNEDPYVGDPVSITAQLIADGGLFSLPGFDFHLTHLRPSFPLNQFIISIFPEKYILYFISLKMQKFCYFIVPDHYQ